MSALKTTEAQLRASKAYRERNRKASSIRSMHSSARSFIRKYASQDDLDDLLILMDNRRKALENAPTHEE